MMLRRRVAAMSLTLALATVPEAGFRTIGKANIHTKLHDRYVDVIIVERLL
jgi:hypothetical protein